MIISTNQIKIPGRVLKSCDRALPSILSLTFEEWRRFFLFILRNCITNWPSEVDFCKLNRISLINFISTQIKIRSVEFYRNLTQVGVYWIFHKQLYILSTFCAMLIRDCWCAWQKWLEVSQVPDLEWCNVMEIYSTLMYNKTI